MINNKLMYGVMSSIFRFFLCSLCLGSSPVCFWCWVELQFFFFFSPFPDCVSECSAVEIILIAPMPILDAHVCTDAHTNTLWTDDIILIIWSKDCPESRVQLFTSCPTMSHKHWLDTVHVPLPEVWCVKPRRAIKPEYVNYPGWIYPLVGCSKVGWVCYHGDLFCAGSLVRTRLTTRISWPCCWDA